MKKLWPQREETIEKFRTAFAGVVELPEEAVYVYMEIHGYDGHYGFTLSLMDTCLSEVGEIGQVISIDNIGWDDVGEDDDFYVAEYAMIDWIADCWLDAGGMDWPLPAYIGFHDSGRVFDLREREWIDEQLMGPPMVVKHFRTTIWLKKDVTHQVVQVLRYLMSYPKEKPDFPVPEHRFFEKDSRWEKMFAFVANETKDSFHELVKREGQYVVSLNSYIPQHDCGPDYIRLFLHWIHPYVDGDRTECLGVVTYQEVDEEDGFVKQWEMEVTQEEIIFVNREFYENEKVDEKKWSETFNC
ncbi:hypothetical protein [Laceyella putida]|uniref:DUF4261 domain-containing protein n=1 Tax=Laceyella putida TaxID=110101 RepID=A0ABW2RHI8_9BACL